MTMLQYCCFTSILCLRHQEGQVGPDPQVVEINKTRPMMIIIVQKSFLFIVWLQLEKQKEFF